MRALLSSPLFSSHSAHVVSSQGIPSGRRAASRANGRVLARRGANKAHAADKARADTPHDRYYQLLSENPKPETLDHERVVSELVALAGDNSQTTPQQTGPD